MTKVGNKKGLIIEESKTGRVTSNVGWGKISPSVGSASMTGVTTIRVSGAHHGVVMDLHMPQGYNNTIDSQKTVRRWVAKGRETVKNEVLPLSESTLLAHRILLLNKIIRNKVSIDEVVIEEDILFIEKIKSFSLEEKKEELAKLRKESSDLRRNSSYRPA